MAISWPVRLAALLLAVSFSAGCVISPRSAKWQEKSNSLFIEQVKGVEQARKSAGAKQVIFAAFALGSESAAFQADAILARDVLRSIKPELPVLLMSNELQYSDITYPFATKRNVELGLGAVAKLADREGLVILLFTSHGVPRALGVNIGVGDWLQQISAEELKKYLEPLRPVPTIIIISACFSGSFVPALADQHRIIITSAAANRSSFGCAPESKGTYFIQAFFPRDIEPEMSLSKLFSRSVERVSERERKEKLTPSQPQISIGSAMGLFSGVPLRTLLSPKL